jgi:hypothetical protein
MDIEHHELPGVSLRRRAFLRGALALPAMGLLSGWVGATTRRVRPIDGSGDGNEDVASFLQDWGARAQAIVSADPADDEAALHELCAGLARLDPAAFPGRRFEAYKDDSLTSGPVFFEGAFVVVELELEPDAVIPPHNHVGYDFVTLGARGEVRVRHYEPETGAPDPSVLGESFRLREVSSAVLTAGRTSTLTRTRANIHGFTAGPMGATMLDFGLHFPDPGDGPSTASHLEIDPAPTDVGQRIYEGHWIGNIYAKDGK